MSSSCVDAPPDHTGETGIQGTVVRGAEPVEGAYVRLTGAGDEFVAELPSRADGSFRFFVAEGDWQLICLAPDSPRLVQPVKLAKGNQVQVTFQLAG